ncbi:hypothetical protein WNY37_07935 [Henriciella sp. AS95]|uniref:hypothetical protein n=1 Tax=Henriciella sp. AS95 TaxID=3135782 RepID=UPI00317EF997
MTTRVAALALAATPLLAAPAFADAPARSTVTASPALTVALGDASFYVSIGNDRWRGRNGRYYGRSTYGQSPWEVRQMRRSAMQQCAAAIQRKGYRAGFRDIDIDDDVRVRQTGRNSFHVRFDDVEFEGRRRELERDISCSVDYGRVVSLSGIPQPGRRGYGFRDDHRGNSWGHNNHRGSSWGNRGYSNSRYDRNDHDRRADDRGRNRRGDDDDQGRNSDRDNNRDWRKDRDDKSRRTGPGGLQPYSEHDLRGGIAGS